ncbi:hypothetical protein EniLVp02_0121 [Vibrio phage EniLVp02]
MLSKTAPDKHGATITMLGKLPYMKLVDVA